MTPSTDGAPPGLVPGGASALKRGLTVPYAPRTVHRHPGETPLAAALYLVSRSNAAHVPQANGVRAMIINADDGDTEAEIKTAAASKLSGVDASHRDAYFDTVVAISDLVAGPLKDEGDAYIITGQGNVQKVG